MTDEFWRQISLTLAAGLFLSSTMALADQKTLRPPAHAAPQRPTQCEPHDLVVARLSLKYGEERKGMGLAANNQVVELFVGASGSWTITTTSADGRTCLRASGEDWQAERPKPNT